jgi:hypothetical protein
MQKATHAVAFFAPVERRACRARTHPLHVPAWPLHRPIVRPRGRVAGAAAVPHARNPTPGASAQSRPRHACELNGPLLTAPPALGIAKPGAASRPILVRFHMTGFAGFLRIRDGGLIRSAVYLYSIRLVPVMNLPGITPPSAAAPGSLKDNANRKKHGLLACVVPLRFSGVFLPVQLLRCRPMPVALLVSSQFSGAWITSLYDREGERKVMNELWHARVVKRRDASTVVLAGLEWDDGFLRQWPQSWLCAPSQENADLLLGHLSPWLRRRYLEGGGQLAIP